MNCPFCSVAAFYGKRYRSRPVQEVLRDAEYLRGKRVFIVDDNLEAYGDRLYELLPALAPFKFRLYAQVDSRFALNEKLLDLAQAAGMETVFIGLESVVPARLHELGKGWINLEEFKKAARNLHARGILFAASLIFGVGPENEDTVKQTLDFLLEIQADYLALYFYTPLPGTRLFQELSEKKIPFSRDWSRYHGNLPLINYEGSSAEKMEELYWSLYQDFYKVGAILKRHWHIPQRPLFWATSLGWNLLMFRMDVRRHRSMFYNGASYLDLLPWYSSEK